VKDLSGAAYLYNTSGQLLQTFQDPKGIADDYFGNSVAISGTYVLIGAVKANYLGSAYLYNTSGQLLQTYQDPAEFGEGYFGTTVALSGANVLIGGAYVNGYTRDAYLYNTSGQLLQTYEDPNESDEFGATLALSGTNVLLGAEGSSSGAGAAYLYNTSGQLLQTFQDPSGSGDAFFGSSLALSGTYLLVGAYDLIGAAYLYNTSGQLLQTFQDPNESGRDYFGSTAALSGTNALVGGEDTNAACYFTSAQYQLSVTSQPAEPNVAPGLPQGQIASSDTFDVQVSVDDAEGNLDTDYSGNLTISLANSGTGPGGGELGGTLTEPVQSGVADFNDLTISQPGTGYALTASDGNGDTVTTDPFTVVPDISVLSLFTTDSNEVYITYDINSNHVPNSFDIDIFRSSAQQYGSPASGGTSATSIEVASLYVGTPDQGQYTQGVNFLTGNSGFSFPVTQGAVSLAAPLAPAPELPYVLAVVDPNQILPSDISTDRGDSTGNFRIYTIAAVAQGFSFAPGLAGWVQPMVNDLLAQGYNEAFPIDWNSSLQSLEPGQTQLGGDQLFQEIVAAATDLENCYSLNSDDIIDVQLIGHSRGSAVIDRAIEDLLASQDLYPVLDPAMQDAINNAGTIPGQLLSGYYKLTFLDPHPANQNTVDLASVSPYSALTGTLGIAGLAFYAYASGQYDDPNIYIPGRVNQVEDFYEQDSTSSVNPSASASYEYLFNLEGESLSEIQVANTTQTKVDPYNLSSLQLGHTDIWQWYESNVIPNLFSGGEVPPIPPANSSDYSSSEAATQIALLPSPELTVDSNGDFDPSAGAPFTVYAYALTAQGTLATDFEGSITVSLADNPGETTLGGTLTVNAVNGVATFSGLTLSNPATGYTLEALSPGLTSGTAPQIDIEPDQLAVTLQPPATVAAGRTFPVTIAAETRDGTIDTSFSGNVTLGLYSLTETLSGQVTEPAIDGIATFPSYSVDTAGDSVVLAADATSAASATTEQFDVTPANATQLQASILPGGNITVGQSFTEQVWAEDSNGNVDTTFNGDVTLSLTGNTGGATLGGILTVPAVNGLATFTGLTISAPGTGYAIQASGDGFTTTNTIYITPAGTATQLVVTTQPASTVESGDGLDLIVTAADGNGTVDTSFTGNVSLALNNLLGQSSSGLGGVTTEAAVNGVATFSGLTVSQIGQDYTLQASASGLTNTSSNPFSVLYYPDFADLSAPTIPAGSDTTTISGTLNAKAGDQLIPAGESVLVTLNGISQFAILDSDDTFSTTFQTNTLAASNSPYSIELSYQGDADFNVASSSSSVTVLPADVATSTVSVSSAKVAAGSSVTVTLQAEDAAGNYLTTGGLTVAFSPGSASGGAGSFSTVTDNGNGTYTATFTGTIAGINTIAATIDREPVTTIPAAITVTPGLVDPGNSLVTVSASTIQLGGVDTITIQARDANGNHETSGDLASVAIALANKTGGRGTFSKVLNNKNGTYTATFTGTLDGSNAITATVNGKEIASTAPVTISGGTVSVSESTVSVPSPPITAGSTTTVTLQAKYPKNQNELAGGLTVLFKLGSTTGGQGTFSSVTDNGNGTYTATFTGTAAGKNTIRAYIDGKEVTSTPPKIDVVTGPYSLSKSVMTVSSGMVTASGKVVATLQLEDAGGNKLSTSGLAVVFTVGDQQFTATQNAKTGTYSASFSETLAGKYMIEATINGQAVTSRAPAVTVNPGPLSLSNSEVFQPSPDSVAEGKTLTVYLQTEDAYGNDLTADLLADGVTFALGSKTGGQGTFGKVTYLGNGKYTVTFTAGKITGNNSIVAYIAGKKLTSSAPTIIVT
jgi:dUTPase